MKEPVDHIQRPRLPWRAADDAITECGYDVTKVKTLTRDEYIARFKKLGRQRTAMLTCMTCAETSGRYARWADDPRQAMSREIAWECQWGRNIEDRPQRLCDELNALASLIETHREEFDGIVNVLKRQRDWIEQKQQSAAKAKIKPPRDGWL